MKIIYVQSIPLLNIYQAYQTTSKINLPVFCNIRPITLTLDLETFMFNTFQERKTSKLED